MAGSDCRLTGQVEATIMNNESMEFKGSYPQEQNRPDECGINFAMVMHGPVEKVSELRAFVEGLGFKIIYQRASDGYLTIVKGRVP